MSFGSLGSCTLAGSGTSASCQASLTPSGTGVVGADYGGDGAHAVSSGQSSTVTVNPRPTSTVLSCASAAVSAGAALTCTATVNDPLLVTPTGTVSFTSGIGNPTCTLTGAGTSGAASCSVQFTPSTAGSYTVSAAYGGDSVRAASTSDTLQVVVTAPPAPANGGSGNNGSPNNGAGSGSGGGSTTTPATPKASVTRIAVAGTTASVGLKCSGGGICKLKLTLSIVEKVMKKKTKTVTLGSASVSLAVGKTKTVELSLNGTGKKLLARDKRLKVKLAVTQGSKVVKSEPLSFRQPKKT